MIININFQRLMKALSVAIVICVLYLFSLWPVSSFAKDEGGIDIRNFTLKIDKNGTQQASMFVDYRLPSTMRDALTHGIPLTAQVDFTLRKHRSWWWNTSEKLLDIRFQLKYHSLSKHYVLTRLDTEQHWSFSTLGGALQQMGKIFQQPLPQLENIDIDEHYYLFVQAILAAETLNLPLKFQSYFNKKYQLESEGILWSFP